MGRKIILVLGNGFSIDFIKHYFPDSGKVNIDLGNLFKLGHSVPWPVNNRPGFLSSAHCPNLWSLGASPCIDATASKRLMEDIITCANVFFLANANRKYLRGTDVQEKTHIKAYRELVYYLNNLFIHYNDQIKEISRSKIADWPWAKFFEKIAHDDSISEVIVISYNYDIWLERILDALGIKYEISGPVNGCSGEEKRIKIIKPHGSISFVPRTRNEDSSAFQIEYKKDAIGDSINDFEVKMNGMKGYYSGIAIIPPAGDTLRFPSFWASHMRTEVRNKIEKFSENDLLYLVGLSYWHVDRNEIDQIITSIPPEARVSMINPDPSRELNAVLTNTFGNYFHFPSSAEIWETL